MTQSQRRPVPRNDGGELDTAWAFLTFQRESLLRKCEGLGEEDLRRSPVPSGTSLLWLVGHSAVGERYWFAHHVGGTIPADAPFDFDDPVPAGRDAAGVIDGYRSAIAESDAILRRVGDPAAGVARPVDGKFLTVRWVLAHFTTETARHAGHADILRELIDGVTGR